MPTVWQSRLRYAEIARIFFWGGGTPCPFSISADSKRVAGGLFVTDDSAWVSGAQSRLISVKTRYLLVSADSKGFVAVSR